MEYGWAMDLRRTWMLAAALGVGLCACKQSAPCEQACLRVAACKLEATQGDPVLGEKRPPADPSCLHKCETSPDDFAKCEGAKRTCPEIKACSGALH